MTQSIYDSERLAYGYAHHRPPVHQAIATRICTSLGLTEKLPRGLDIGCGAGLSTAALETLCERAVGIEPVTGMMRYRTIISATAGFLCARAEQLPFPSRCFDMLTAAGSINYADREQFFPEAARVLTDRGQLVVYDFSAGRTFPEDERLDQWFTRFEQRYPSPPGYHFEIREIPFDRYGLRLASYEEFRIALPMTLESYLAYACSETSVEQAIQDGTPEAEIQDWCRNTLAPLFEMGSREVLFTGYIACITHDEGRIQ